MQKKIAFGIVLVTLALTLAVMVYFMYFVHPQPDMPAPTDRPLKQDEGAEHNDAREAWIEQMHRTAPGVNWRLMDQELRLQLAASRSEQYALGGNNADVWGYPAAGYAVGKWNEVGSFNTAGRVRATEIDFQTGTVYAFSQGGNLWKGDLEGDNWTVINDNFNVQSAIFYRRLGDELVLVTNEWAVQSVYRTPDEGLSWTACAGLENMTAWAPFWKQICSIMKNALFTYWYRNGIMLTGVRSPLFIVHMIWEAPLSSWPTGGKMCMVTPRTFPCGHQGMAMTGCM